jgi:signal transduction histidine kinase
MSRAGSRLRVRLAVLGVVGVVTPMLVLLAVAAWTTEEVSVAADGTTVTETGGLSAWIPATVAMLVLPAAVAAWWWAGREVALQLRAAGAVDDQRRLIEDTSHQLRTPIAVLIANADVTLAEPGATIDELRAALRTSRDTAASMHAVVEGLLDDARRRRLDADLSATDVVAITARVCHTHTPRAAAKQVAIRRTGPGHLTASVDAGALARAIDAIVDNAVRYAPRHTEVVVAVAGDEHTATISITDHGPGIDAEHRAHIFDRYWTSDRSRSGIGLDVVAEAADDAFEVDVDSPIETGGGTMFVLTVPRRRIS